MSYLNATWSQIGIETPENIEIDYELAGPGTRMAAFMFDYFILSVVLGSVSYVLAMLAEAMGILSDRLSFIYVIIILVLYFLGGYFILFEILMNGQTPGKRIMKIRVRMSDGTPVTVQATIARNLFRLIDCQFPFQYAIGSLSLVFTQKTQRPGDLVAATIVVKETAREVVPKFRWRHYKNRSGKVAGVTLSPEEFDFFMEYVRIHMKLSKDQRSKISRKLLVPVLQRADLSEDLQIRTQLSEMKALPEKEQYKKTEPIMRDILQRYSNAQ